MPTLEEWVTALSAERVVTVESSQTLIESIETRQAVCDAILQAKGKTIPARKAQLAPAPNIAALADIMVAPIHLLHRLGVVTTPPVPNLADICATWAQYRYLWAFELPNGTVGDRLRLSAPAKKIDFHQKGLMSDQIGVGMAALVMETLFNAPSAIDVDVALDDPTAWPLDSPGSAIPDYIFEPFDKSAQFVVECKGTRCGRAAAIDQLRRGVEQVPSLVFTDGRPAPTTLVIGTQITDEETHVYIVDPPASDEPPPEKPKRVGPRKWQITSGQAFDRRAGAIAQAKLLSYALSDDAYIAKLRTLNPDFARPQEAPPRPVVTETTTGRFVGTLGTLRAMDGIDVSVFQGMEVGLRARYSEDDAGAIAEGIAALAGRIEASGNRRESGYGFELSENAETTVLRSFAPDGTMLEFRLTPR